MPLSLPQLRGFVLLTACFFGLPYSFGNPGIWLATPLAELLTTLFHTYYLYKSKKKAQKNIVSLQHGNDDKEILPKIQTPGKK